jgi:peptidoglycan biosynthesis protein MviN/MurJ (putative lipid II flippase)
VAASISGIAIKAADQFYISRYFGSEAFAEYANGFIQLPFISMITSATSVVLMPAFSKMIHEKTEIENVVKLWKNTLEKSAVLTYPLVIFFIFNAAPIVILLYSETYFNSVVYFQIAMILNFFNIIVFAPLLFSMGETKFYFRIHFFFAIWSWLGAYALIQIFFNPVAIALFSVLNSILLVILCVLKSSKLLKVGFLSLFPISKILKISLHSSIVLIIISQVLSYANIDNKVFLLAVSGISFLLLLLLTSGFFKIDYLESFKIILFKVKKNA